MARHLWLVRHGETNSNRQRIFQGQIDSPLNERGVEQARATGRFLADIPFERVHASDLQRAAITAQLIVAGRALEVRHDPDLREMHYGVLQGTVIDDAAQVLAPFGLSDAWTSGRFHDELMSLPGGESATDVRQRACRFLQQIDADVQSSASEHILIVSHGGTLRVLLTVLLELPLAARRAFDFGNCGVSHLSYRQGRYLLDYHNRTPTVEG